MQISLGRLKRLSGKVSRFTTYNKTPEQIDYDLNILNKEIATELYSFLGDTRSYYEQLTECTIDAGPQIFGVNLWEFGRLRHIESGVQSSKHHLEEIITGLERNLMMAREEEERRPFGVKIFVVHGHDEGTRESVARFIEKLGFTPIILH
jgi:hypothetical protein